MLPLLSSLSNGFLSFKFYRNILLLKSSVFSFLSLYSSSLLEPAFFSHHYIFFRSFSLHPDFSCIHFLQIFLFFTSSKFILFLPYNPSLFLLFHFTQSLSLLFTLLPYIRRYVCVGIILLWNQALSLETESVMHSNLADPWGSHAVRAMLCPLHFASRSARRTESTETITFCWPVWGLWWDPPSILQSIKTLPPFSH
jgi:hypothetical protein